MKFIDYLHSLNAEETEKLIEENICNKIECRSCPLWERCKEKLYLSWKEELEGEYEVDEK